MKTISAIIFGVICSLATQNTAQAQVVDRERIIRSLPAVEHRDLMIHQERKAYPRQVPTPTPPSILLRVGFEYRSYKLDDDGIAQLRELGAAMGHPQYSGRTFIIIGHTDGFASHAYNDGLSLRRAARIGEFLMHEFDIAGPSLLVQGMGKRRLLVPTDPMDSRNRRVEVRLAPQ